MDHNFTQQIKDWLDTPFEERDFEKGAHYLLKLSGNQIMYRNIIANPKGKADFIEYQLQKYYNLRVLDLMNEQVAEMEQQVESIVAEHIPLAVEADTKQKGKREDHDHLPDEIKARFVENLGLLRRMRERHLKLRTDREFIAEDGFYSPMKEAHNYDANDNAFLDTLGYPFDFSTLGSKADADVDPDQRLCIGMNHNANINWIVVGQPHERRLNVVKSFYVKFERKIPAFVADFCCYYAEHSHKTLVYYYDATALGSNYAVNDQDFRWVVVHEFEKHGWAVEPVYLGNPMPHHEKNLLINQIFSGKQRLMPFFNRSNNEDLILAIQTAGVSKSSSDSASLSPFLSFLKPLRPLLKHRTDGSDAFDVLYMGCEKFPFRDSFAISIFGVL